MRESVLAIAAHPDDIEFVMASTLIRLIECGWQAHYFNIADGSCGSLSLDRKACAKVRLEEARQAADKLPAVFYPPICRDLEIFYDHVTHARVAAVVRQAQPSIVLTHALSDYMEDHQNAARLAVGAAFVRAMPNFTTQPSQPTCSQDLALYHAQPHGNRDPMRGVVVPTHFVDVTNLRERKRKLLSCHASQNTWLDQTQGMSSYLQTMEQLNAEVGAMSTCYERAEGWRQHVHMGLSSQDSDPLAQALSHCLRIR